MKRMTQTRPFLMREAGSLLFLRGRQEEFIFWKTIRKGWLFLQQCGWQLLHGVKMILKLHSFLLQEDPCSLMIKTPAIYIPAIRKQVNWYRYLPEMKTFSHSG